MKIEFPDLGPIEMPTCLESPPPKDPFLIPKNRTMREIAKRKLRRGIRKMVKPENAAALIPDFPEESGDITHMVIRGDFVLGDLLPPLAKEKGPMDELIITTLGLSENNCHMLANLLKTKKTRSIHLLLSHYFTRVDREDLWITCRKILLPLGVKIGVERIHTKIILAKMASGQHYVLEGSANLRSCGSLEQLTIFQCANLFSWHREWILQLVEEWEVTE